MQCTRITVSSAHTHAMLLYNTHRHFVTRNDSDTLLILKTRAKKKTEISLQEQPHAICQFLSSSGFHPLLFSIFSKIGSLIDKGSINSLSSLHCLPLVWESLWNNLWFKELCSACALTVDMPRRYTLSRGGIYRPNIPSSNLHPDAICTQPLLPRYIL